MAECLAPMICGHTGQCSNCRSAATEAELIQRGENYKTFLMPQVPLFDRRERGGPTVVGADGTVLSYDTGNHVIQYVCRGCGTASAQQTEICGNCRLPDSRRGEHPDWRLVYLGPVGNVLVFYQHEPCGLIRRGPEKCTYCRLTQGEAAETERTKEELEKLRAEAIKSVTELREALASSRAYSQDVSTKNRDLSDDYQNLIRDSNIEISRLRRRLRRANEFIDEMRDSLAVRLNIWWRRRPWRRD